MGLEISRVTGGLMIMAMSKDGSEERVIWGDVHAALIHEDMVTIFLVQEARPECGENVFQRHLQVLEDERVRLRYVSDTLVEFDVNQVDKEGVREKDS